MPTVSLIHLFTQCLSHRIPIPHTVKWSSLYINISHNLTSSFPPFLLKPKTHMLISTLKPPMLLLRLPELYQHFTLNLQSIQKASVSMKVVLSCNVLLWKLTLPRFSGHPDDAPLRANRWLLGCRISNPFQTLHFEATPTLFLQKSYSEGFSKNIIDQIRKMLKHLILTDKAYHTLHNTTHL